MIPPVIATSRLRLRALAMRDLTVFRKLYGDAETMRHIGRLLLPAQAAESLHATVAAARQSTGPQFFAIVASHSGRSIDLCSIRRVSPRTRRVDVGMMLLPAARARGYGAEVLGALIDTAFRTLPIDAVWVQYRAANVSAASFMRRIGICR